MSHTNQTTNYELSQFLGSDKPAWLVDYNGDMAKIDAQMKVNADAIAQNASDIDTIEGAIGVDGLAGRVTALENDVTGIENAIGDTQLPTVSQTLSGSIAEIVNTDVAGLASDIQRVEGTANSAATAATAASQLAYTIADVYDSAETYAVGDYAIYQNTLYKCTTAILIGEPFDATKWTSIKVMDEVGQGGGGTTYTAGSGIDITNNVISVKAPLTDTLTAGSTTAVISDASITANSFVIPVASEWGITPTSVVVANGSVTLTFEAQASDIIVGVFVLS